MNRKTIKRLLIPNIPYVVIGWWQPIWEKPGG